MKISSVLVAVIRESNASWGECYIDDVYVDFFTVGVIFKIRPFDRIYMLVAKGLRL